MTKAQARWVKAYFHWLVEQIRHEGPKTYWDILWVMHEKDFVFIVPRDDNRLVDGLELRPEFLIQSDAPPSIKPELFGQCSVLEVMIALSRRMSFVAGEDAEGWAWVMMSNLGFDKFSDPLGPRKRQRSHEILNNLVWRHYQSDGSGGFFPLAWPETDQTTTELWYQMQAYAMELHPEDRRI